MHAPAVGSILRGLHRPSGLNAGRSRSIIARSSGENSFGMKSIFSTPMPCSPVTLPPHADALFQDLVAGRQHALHLVGVALVEQQDRMNVAVAGMEDVGDAQIDTSRRCAGSRAGCAAACVRGTTPSCVQ